MGKPNVALELPTGAGKTLIGLLIAEFRRQVRHERVVYICPTRQLCNQVRQHADLYGIPSSLLTGSKWEYDRKQFTNYQRANAIAITTYSGIFNSSPGIDDPELIICDDAHAAENFISSLWSLDVDKGKLPNVYKGLVEFLGDSIPDDMARRVGAKGNDPYEKVHVDIVPAPAYSTRIRDLADLLDVHCHGTKLSYSWSMIRGHLEACVIYVSPDSILIRPVIPPTETHAPFSGASQRVFMSATLGEGGDLERITGVRTIKRLPLPPEWEKRNTGRRLILFPNLLADEESSRTALSDLVNGPERLLVLARDNRLLDRFCENYENSTKIFLASDIETDITPFTSSPGPAALVLSNRYDGIDLPGEECRRLVLIGLPSFSNLQERFLWQRLGASSVLRDRTRTRIAQGLGRCTRDESDYALALMVGTDILKWCCTSRNTQNMNPELQAEIAFGLENSEDRTVDEFRRLCVAFFQQGADWADANQYIIDLREKTTRQGDEVTSALQKSVTHEIAYVYALWNHDFAKAHEEACAAADALSGGSELKPFRAFWYYLASAAAAYAFVQSSDQKWKSNFIDDVNRALSATISVQWLSGLRRLFPSETANSAVPSTNLDAIIDLLDEWKIVGLQFERNLNNARKDILETNAASFERGLRVLGRMLGCDVRSWADPGAPDCLWLLVGNEGIIFEAKSDQGPDDPTNLITVRQVLTHEAWIRSTKEVSEEASFYTVLITPRSTISEAAKRVAGEIRVVNPNALQLLFERTSTVLNSVRSSARKLSDEALRELVDSEYRSAHLTHEDLKARLLELQISSLPQSGGPSTSESESHGL